ncbi:beta-lactamase [Xylariaceae sp. FL0804]|nr:beta-lactamase [Xylariaceae sp. FL0804]
MPLSETAASELRSLLETAVSGGAQSIPGTAAVVVDKSGNELFVHAAGKRGADSDEDMTLDHVFWIASCTKLLTGLACMQLVERGQLRLDDAAQVAALVPDLAAVRVLRADGTLRARAGDAGATLRQLLTHTAGFAYTFNHAGLRDHNARAGIDELQNSYDGLRRAPMVFDPGEAWMYGTGVTWAGIVLERQTGMGLDQYMRENIFEPLGLGSTTMLPTGDMRARLAHMHRRTPDGRCVPGDPVLPRRLVAETEEELADCFDNGGGGLYTKPQEYTRVLAVLLNGGACPRTGVRLVSEQTVDAMFTNQIPHMPDFGRQDFPSARSDVTQPFPQLYPEAGDPPQGWGITFMLCGGATGRAAGTAWWGGLPNLYWWCDRQNGVAGLVATQILPFGDPAVLRLWAQVETAVYKGLSAA